MNYLSHARELLADDPWAAAGTSLPDWLGAVDRRCRIVKERVVALSSSSASTPEERAVARGVLTHLDDDRWFHATSAFGEVTSALTQRMRAGFGGAHPRMRASFLAHILMEMLLDAELDAQGSVTFDGYYDAIAVVDEAELERIASLVTVRETRSLAPGVRRFKSVRFLFGYRDDDALLRRLGGLLARVRQPPLPQRFAELLPEARALVGSRAEELLTRPR